MTDRVLLALPSYTGTIRCETMMALIHEVQILNQMDIAVEMKVAANDSILPRTRNQFLADFYHRKDYTHLFYLDHDIWWQPGAMARLLQHDVDFVAGVYPKRSDPLKFPCDLLEETTESNGHPLIKALRVPGGFMCLSRNCVEGMFDRYWALQYEEPAMGGKVAIAAFDFTLVSGQYMGEDVVFCERWRAAGGDIWVDPAIKFHHVGFKRYEGCLKDSLEEKYPHLVGEKEPAKDDVA